MELLSSWNQATAATAIATAAGPSITMYGDRYASVAEPVHCTISGTAAYNAYRLAVMTAMTGFSLGEANRAVYRDLLKRLIEDLPNMQRRIAEIDAVTRHDVKAIERYIASFLPDQYKPKVHHCFTSQDPNSIAQLLMIRDTVQVVTQQAKRIPYEALAQACDKTVFMTRTHGQLAVPAYLARELGKYQHRINQQLERITKKCSGVLAKVSGSIGNYSTISVAYDSARLVALQDYLSSQFGPLQFDSHARQVPDYTPLCELVSSLGLLALLLLEYSENLWLLVRDGVLTQHAAAGSVGSSVMAHKTNPWNLENAKARAGSAYDLSTSICRRLMVLPDSRDMSDSTVFREDIPRMICDLLLAIKQISITLPTLSPCHEYIQNTLENYSVLSEYVQTHLREHHSDRFPDPYSLLADATKGRHMSRVDYVIFIEKLELPEWSSSTLLALTPSNYPERCQWNDF